MGDWCQFGIVRLKSDLLLQLRVGELHRVRPAASPNDRVHGHNDYWDGYVFLRPRRTGGKPTDVDGDEQMMMISICKSMPDLHVTIEDMVAEVRSDVETCRFSVLFLRLGKRTRSQIEVFARLAK